jgi:hypothetical protein
MDDRFSLFGYRFGLNAILDVIPGFGDIATTIIALYILGRAIQYKIPVHVIIHMLWNIAVYFVVGLIPWFGDLFGIYWKPNRRNITLLRKTLERREFIEV